MDRTPRLGLIGCGRVAIHNHVRVLAAMGSRAELVAIAEADDDRRAEALAAAPDAKGYADYHELLASPDVDAVVICLPTGMHAEAAVAAFEAGKHAYLEKPIAIAMDDAQRILDARASSGRIGMMGFNYRYNGLYKQLRAAIRSGQIGKTVAVRSVFTTAPRELPAWKLARTTGGGALLDLATHHIDLVHFLFDQDIVNVKADIAGHRTEHDSAALTMTTSGGIQVQMFVSISAAEDDRFEVYGDKGMLCVDRHRCPSVVHRPVKRGGSRGDRMRGVIAALAEGLARMNIAARPASESSYKSALGAFVKAVTTGIDAPIDMVHGVRSLAVVVAAEESAQSGHAVTVCMPPAPKPATTPAGPLPLPEDVAQMLAPATDAGPDLSVVVVSQSSFASLRRTVEHLRAQTLADHIELIMVAPSTEALGDMPASSRHGFHSVKAVGAGHFTNIDAVAARGIAVAAAPIIGLVEDHAYPAPRWAEAVLAAHADAQWSAVGSTVLNANPDSTLSWTNLLMSYGQWVDPKRGGEVASVSRHNITYKRHVLEQFNGTLERKLTRDGGMLADLAEQGHRFYLATDALIEHVNPSRVESTVQLRFNAGRLYGAERARRANWGWFRKLVYIAGGPLIPAVRFVRFRQDLFTSGRCDRLAPRVYPAMLFGLALDAGGQMMGYAFGAGDAPAILERFEYDRMRHLNTADRRRFAEAHHDR